MRRTHYVCTVTGCGGYHVAKGLCDRHYQSLRGKGDPLAAKTQRARGTGSLRPNGYIGIASLGQYRLEHIRVAEKALGARLPPGAVVHHVDQNRSNNEPSNLVICPSSAYHNLLHARMRSQDACGNPNWHKCSFCKQYDAPERLRSYRQHNSMSFNHAACERTYRAALKQSGESQ